MAFQAFDELLQQLRDQHNQQLDELRLELEAKDDQIMQYKLRVKQLESELNVDNSDEEVEHFAIKWRSISTQTDHNECDSNEDYDLQVSESHVRRPDRPPARKATRRIIVSQRRSPTPSSSTTASQSSKKIVLSEAELRSHIQKNMKRIYHSSDDNCSHDEDMSLGHKNNFNTRRFNNRTKLRLSLSRNPCGRRRDQVWQHFQDLGQSISGRFRRSKCVFCGQEFHISKANLMIRHLAQKCDLCPKEIIDEYSAKLEANIGLNSSENLSQSNSGVRLGGRPRGKAWEHFEDLGRSEHGTFRIAKCIYCNTIYNISKLKLLNRHLAKECVMCPKEVMIEFCNQMEKSVISFGDQAEDCSREQELEEEEIGSEVRLCGRKRAKVWEHYKDMGRAKHGSFRKAKCLYCNELFPLSRLTSMTRHLAKHCVLCPKQVANQYLVQYNNYCMKTSADNNNDLSDDNPNDFDDSNDSLFYEQDLNPSFAVERQVRL